MELSSSQLNKSLYRNQGMSVKWLGLGILQAIFETDPTACIQLDCTVQLRTEGGSIAVVGIVSVHQKFHPLAYAVCTTDNRTATFKFLMGEVQKAIEGLVELQTYQQLVITDTNGAAS